MHSVHDQRSLESQLVVHVEPIMEEDEKPSFGPTIGEDQGYTHTTNKVIVLADTFCQEVLEHGRIVWQEDGRLYEGGVSCQM